MGKYIDTYKAEEVLARQIWLNNIDLITAVGALKLLVPAADVVEVHAFRNEVYRYIDDYKDDGADFLAGLETAVVIAEKMAGVYEEVEE